MWNSFYTTTMPKDNKEKISKKLSIASAGRELSRQAMQAMQTIVIVKKKIYFVCPLEWPYLIIIIIQCILPPSRRHVADTPARPDRGSIDFCCRFFFSSSLVYSHMLKSAILRFKPKIVMRANSRGP